ncbi:succinate dehydrogenase, cytochrome b556 subunit [Erythrobacteraceae bacterium CFH 75059]|uniref:succinate dehydrogenase, cytochrome b556 subunit n=1 Tax=Qipengyuania thermophila TaxID=2509361 RepID=UPI00102251AA|nr:succinate dehydrogenase, cytochrome b556 subunit [Qipengyuania thermophila]TCD05351.1 succinate dehydrogenase, cytochrome b556 subunit [Erythrobacteraceae bacterium CFH 75059]
MVQRPLSPHLTIWRWGPHMLVSILHRITGNGMAVVGLGVLLWWLGALASGPAAYDSFSAAMTSPLGYVVLVGLTWAFFNHMASGIRHWFMDIGANYELRSNKNSARGVVVAGIVLTALFWGALLLL